MGAFKHSSRAGWGLALVLGGALGAFACNESGSDAEANEKQPAPGDEARSDKQRLEASAPSADVLELTHNNTNFAFNLLRAEAPSGNFFYSPQSISTAVAMVYAGARGDTASEIAEALQFKQPAAELHGAFNALDQALNSRGKNALGADGNPFRLRMLNAAWVQKGAQFEASYLDLLAENYGAGINLLDFFADSEGSRGTINQWVSAQTEERIPELMPEGSINQGTQLVLTNAVYFNASWGEAFEPEATFVGDFELEAGGEVEVELMRQNKFHGYMAGEGFQAVQLQYSGEEVSLLAILPDSGKFAEVEQNLSADTITEILGSLQGYAVDLVLPKFEFRTKLSVADALRGLGMEKAFTDEADLSGINGVGGLAIQDIIHEAFVKVNEAGTEAAAATGVAIGGTSAPETREFSATRPFFFLILDNATQAPVFVGRVSNPLD